MSELINSLIKQKINLEAEVVKHPRPEFIRGKIEILEQVILELCKHQQAHT